MTLFNRGKTHPGLFPDLEKLHGDRKSDMTALEGRKWDAVIDTSAYIPADVTRSATLLAPNVHQYLLISTVSVYAKLDKPGLDETAPLATTTEPGAEKVTNENYGALKALCEKAAEKAAPGKVTVVRPGLIVGPGDATDRFTYWPVRVARGGRVAAPGRPSRAVQFIDVRDLAEWIVKLARTDTAGAFNATGPREPLTMERLLHTCREVAGSDARFEWIDDATLARKGVAPWKEMPLFVPESEPHAEAFMAVPIARALATGLRFRPLATTIADTLAWARTRPADHVWKAGLDREREEKLV